MSYLKTGSKVYFVEDFRLVEYIVISITTKNYKVENEEGRYLLLSKSRMGRDEDKGKEKYFLSKMVGMSTLEKRLEEALSQIRQDMKLHKSKFFGETEKEDKVLKFDEVERELD